MAEILDYSLLYESVCLEDSVFVFQASKVNSTNYLNASSVISEYQLFALTGP